MMILAINWTNALIVTVVGFLLVFVVLILLIVIITLFGKVMAPTVKVPKQTKGEAAACPAIFQPMKVQLSQWHFIWHMRYMTRKVTLSPSRRWKDVILLGTQKFTELTI